MTEGSTRNYVFCPSYTVDYRIEKKQFGLALVANRDIEKGEHIYEESLEFQFGDVQEGDHLLLVDNYDYMCEKKAEAPISIPINRRTLLLTHGVGTLVPQRKGDTTLKECWHLESPGMLMNHSCDPTVAVTSFDSSEGEDIAARDIKKGEELTCDYGFFDYEAAGTVFKCACGASNCRGRRVAFNMCTEEEKETLLSGTVSDAVLARHQHSLGKGPPVEVAEHPVLPRKASTVPRLVVPGPSFAEAHVAIKACEPTLEGSPKYGLFATKDFKAGRRVYWFWVQPWPVFPDGQKDSVVDLVAASPSNKDTDLPEGTIIRVDPSLCASHDKDTGAHEFSGFDLLTHHSCNPNTVYKHKAREDEDNWSGVYACRDIKAGEQLLIDFNCTLWERPTAKCHCGAENCRGWVGGFSKLEQAAQEELMGLTWKRKPDEESSGDALAPFILEQMKENIDNPVENEKKC